MKKTLIFGAIAAVATPIAAVVSCNNDEDRNKTIAIVVSDESNPFFKNIIDAATKKAKDKGYKVVSFNSADDLSKETGFMDIITTEKYAGVIWNPINSKGSKKAGDKLKESKIPFTLVDRTIENFTGNIASVSTDNDLAAKQVVLKALEKLKTDNANIKSFKIGHLKGKDGAAAAQARNDGFVKSLAEFKKNNSGYNFTKNEDVADWDTAKATTKVQSWSGFKNLHLIFAENDNMAVGVVKAYQGETKYPLIIGFDGIDVGKKNVDSGKMFATVEQDTKTMGELSVEILLEVLLDDDTITTKSNYKSKDQNILLPGVIYENTNWPNAK